MTNHSLEQSMFCIEPLCEVFTMEYHDDAYKIWRQKGVRGRILVHLDGHIDLGFFADEDPKKLLNVESKDELKSLLCRKYLWKFGGPKIEDKINIGNYIYPAIKDEIVRSFYWVVPDPVWNSGRQRRLIRKLLKNITNLLPQADRAVKFDKNSFGINVCGCALNVLPLEHLPKINEDVLLDIDTDFLFTQSVDGDPPYFSSKKIRPWISPKALVEKIRQKNIVSSLVTIAYSVEGGFTPLEYRYVGDELAELLKGNASREFEDKARLRQTIKDLLYEDRLDEAISRLETYLEMTPDDAAAHFDLFRAWRKKGVHDSAVRHYEYAVAINGAYNTAYNNDGLKLLNCGRIDEAKVEYRRMFNMDPSNNFSIRGLIDIAINSKDYDSARQMCIWALENNSDDAAIYIKLGNALSQMGDFNGAMKAFEEALRINQYDPQPHYFIGDIYYRQNEVDKAIDAYRTARKLGFTSFGVHLRLGSLYRRKGNLYKARKEYAKALSLMFMLASSYIKHWLTYAGRVLSGR